MRTPGWGTPDPEITGLAISETDDAFEILYAARYVHGSASLSAEIRFSASADGRLQAAAEIHPKTDFETNRTGFVVLHPLEGVAGCKVEVEHASAGTETLVLPGVISPGQPLFDIRGISHFPRPGLSVAVRFEGDVFEMEDHRNWSDASFKTYSRPIGLPYPFTLKAGKIERQSVLLTLSEDGKSAAPSTGTKDENAIAQVTVGAPTGVTLPRIAIGLPSSIAGASLESASRLAAMPKAHLLLRHDPAAGDGPGDIEAAGELARRTGLPVAFELIFVATESDLRSVVAEAASLLAGAGVTPVSIAAFPKRDERSFQPGEPRPPAPDEASIYRALRESFPGIPAGGGSPAFFAEFNRKRPPAGTFDFITHATTPTVHAADDLSVVETLQSLPHIVRSARAIAGDVPYRIGPIGIGARLNPYGAAPDPNPHNGRVGLAATDPRQRGLLGAAWHVGYAATITPFAIDTLALGAPVGPFGLVSTPQSHARPWWDASPAHSVFPLYHVAADLAAASGSERLDTSVSTPRLAALGWISGSRRSLLLANLTAEPVTVALRGCTLRNCLSSMPRASGARPCSPTSSGEPRTGSPRERHSLSTPLPSQRWSRKG